MSIPTTRLGRTGLTVSRLALGTMTFGLQTDEACRTRSSTRPPRAASTSSTPPTCIRWAARSRRPAAPRKSSAAGCSSQGPAAAAAASSSPPRPSDKVGPHSWDQGASRKHLLDAIDASLKRLQTDHVDLYQLHSDDRETPLDESLEALDVIVKSGRARYIGVSNFLAYRLARALRPRRSAQGLTRYVCVQPRYSLLFREIERELLPLAAEEDWA
jgi:aryl-alcohol dehydrogenase-like predicted oxidoreductase